MAEIKPSISWRASLAESGLTPSARLVGFALSTYLNERTSTAYPGGSTLAGDTGLSLRTVRRAIKEMVAHGYLTIIEQGGIKGAQRVSNTYLASIPNRCHVVTGDTDAPVTEPAFEDDVTGDKIDATGDTAAHKLPEDELSLSLELVGEAAEAAPADAKSDIVGRNRDLLAEAIATACRYDLRAMTSTARGPFNRAVKDLRSVNADPDEVDLRARVYRSRFSTPLTPMALAKNWPALTPDAVMADVARAPTLPKAAGAIARARGRS